MGVRPEGLSAMKYSETLHDQVESLQVLSDFSAHSLCDPEQVR